MNYCEEDVILNYIKNNYLNLMAIIISALLYYYGQGEQPYWIAIWIAPAPVLLVSYYENSIFKSISIAFIAYLLGSMNLLIYIDTLLSVKGLLLNAAISSLCFAIIVVVSTRVARHLKGCYGVLVFPSLWVLYEYFCTIFSTSGTYGSLAYTQMNFNSLVQIASITGIWGISFITSLSASTIAYVIIKIQKNNFKQAINIIIFFIIFVGLVISYGKYRVDHFTSNKKIRLDLVVLPQMMNNLTSEDIGVVSKTINQYINTISKIKNNSVDVVLLPEKFIRVSNQYKFNVIKKFDQVAKEKNSIIIFGIRNKNNETITNDAIINFPDKSESGIYSKFHMLPASEGNYMPGNKLYIFKVNNLRAGILICKDMDFVNPAMDYAKKNIDIMFVPALDFWVDEWQHSKPAIMRGIEGGYAVARNAQWGLMTVTDATGRIVFKTADIKTPRILTVTLPISHVKTFYSQYGDWFIYLCILFIITILIPVVTQVRSLYNLFLQRD